MLLQEGDTALILAAEGGHEELVDLLLQKNADINQKGKVRSSRVSIELLIYVSVTGFIPLCAVFLPVKAMPLII